MTDTTAFERAADVMIGEAFTTVLENGIVPEPDHVAAVLLTTRKMAVEQNIGPIAESVVIIADLALARVLPDCVLTRQQLEAEM